MKFNHIDSIEVKNIYNNDCNYKIIEHNNNYDYTVVYFSSNGIYFPNTFEVFNKIIIENNRYEWLNSKNKFPFAKKSIFIRDIYKQWYLKGINSSINNIDKLIAFIKKEHTSKKLILIGVSSGGYIATLIGIILRADYVFSFAGQLTLEYILNNSKDKIVNESYQKWKNYYNLEYLLKKNSIDIFYFVCNESKYDKEHIDISSKYPCIHLFKFQCKTHGIPFNFILLNKIIANPKANLILISKKGNGLIQPSLFWRYFFNPFEYYTKYFFYLLTKVKKIPSYLKKIILE